MIDIWIQSSLESYPRGSEIVFKFLFGRFCYIQTLPRFLGWKLSDMLLSIISYSFIVRLGCVAIDGLFETTVATIDFDPRIL